MLKIVLVGLWAIALLGCASVTVTPLSLGDTTTPGVRYYKSEPYLLVGLDSPKPAAAGALEKPSTQPQPAPVYTVKVVFLPNYNEGYAVVTHSGLGTADGSVKLNEGWQLAEQGAKVDSKIPETITAVGGLLKDVGIPGAFSAKPPLEPGLYRLLWDAKSGTYSRGEKVKLVE